MNPTKNDLPLETRTAVAKVLNERLADLVDLQLQLKQAHWNVKGANFIAIHELFDDLVEEIEEHVDNVAERIVALGGTAEGTVAALSGRSKLPPYPLAISSERDHVGAISTALATAGKGMRAAIEAADRLGDAGSADLFTGISRDLDKKLWFVESHLQAG